MAATMLAKSSVSSSVVGRGASSRSRAATTTRAALITQAPIKKGPSASTTTKAEVPYAAGFTFANEVTVGRAAQVGFAAAVIGERLSGGLGPVAQLSNLLDVPSSALLGGAVALAALNTLLALRPGAATFTPQPAPADYVEATRQPQAVGPLRRVFGVSDTFGFTAANERFVGRVAMLGFVAAIVGELATGGLGPMTQLSAETGISADKLDAVLAAWAAFMALTAADTLVGKKQQPQQ